MLRGIVEVVHNACNNTPIRSGLVICKADDVSLYKIQVLAHNDNTKVSKRGTA